MVNPANYTNRGVLGRIDEDQPRVGVALRNCR